MDTRMIAVINRLEKDISNLDKTLVHARRLLKELAMEARKDGTQTHSTPQTETLEPAAKRYLANQQPRRDGTFPLSYRENDDAD